MVDQELLARNENLAAENRILRAQLKGRLQLSDAERATLGEVGHRLGRLQGSRRGGQCGPAGHHPGLVPQAGGPQIRGLAGPSKPWQASDQPILDACNVRLCTCVRDPSHLGSPRMATGDRLTWIEQSVRSHAQPVKGGDLTRNSPPQIQISPICRRARPRRGFPVAPFQIYRGKVDRHTLCCSTDNGRSPAYLSRDRCGDDRAAGLHRCI
jgi:hypothetical protein